MEYTVEELKVMHSILSAILENRHYSRPGFALVESTVYNIDDFDIATMEKWRDFFGDTIKAINRK